MILACEKEVVCERHFRKRLHAAFSLAAEDSESVARLAFAMSFVLSKIVQLSMPFDMTNC